MDPDPAIATTPVTPYAPYQPYTPTYPGILFNNGETITATGTNTEENPFLVDEGEDSDDAFYDDEGWGEAPDIEGGTVQGERVGRVSGVQEVKVS